jgi:hypothetical protein
MHQTIDLLESDSPDAEVAALRQRIRRALASDLHLPEQHPSVTATMSILAVAADQYAASTKTAPERAAATTLDTWWCIVAHTHALTAR